MKTARSEIVVLTPASRELSDLVTFLRRLGASVAVAGSERRVRRLLGEVPALVLVDFAHGAPLTPVVVAMINHLQDSGRALVLALHALPLPWRSAPLLLSAPATLRRCAPATLPPPTRSTSSSSMINPPISSRSRRCSRVWDRN